MKIMLTIAWIIGTVYASIPSFWLAVHPFARQWRARKGKIFPFLLIIWLGDIAALCAFTSFFRTHRLYETPWAWLAWLAFFAAGISVYRRVGRNFGGDNIIGRTELQPEKHEQRLVTTGMHARVRHPIYLAHLCMLTAWTLGSGLTVLFALWLFAVGTGAIMVRMEEKELVERFGDEYREYQRNVPAVIPEFS